VTIESWRDQESSWWAKLRRACKHVTELRKMISEFESDRPWSVEVEAGPEANELSYRLRILRPVPSDLITAAGDAIHNMRSALDAVAFELASRHLQGNMNPAQEALAEFPIKRDGAEFDEFLKGKRKYEGTAFFRRDIYSVAGIRALRCVQPFAIREEAEALGVQWTRDPDAEYKHDQLARLHALSVIDKHRRLPVLAWTADLIYWSEGPEGESYHWKPARQRTEFVDGAVIGYLVNPSGSTPPQVNPNYSMHLTFDDDPGGRDSNFADRLERLSLVNRKLDDTANDLCGGRKPASSRIFVDTRFSLRPSSVLRR
jgi:hypothetical protein